MANTAGLCRCGAELRNRTYGSECEDCFAARQGTGGLNATERNTVRLGANDPASCDRRRRLLKPLGGH